MRMGVREGPEITWEGVCVDTPSCGWNWPVEQDVFPTLEGRFEGASEVEG